MTPEEFLKKCKFQYENNYVKGDVVSLENALVAVQKAREEAVKDHLRIGSKELDLLIKAHDNSRETAKEDLKTVMDYFDEQIDFWVKRIKEEEDERICGECIITKAMYDVDKDRLLKRLTTRGQSDNKGDGKNGK